MSSVKLCKPALWRVAVCKVGRWLGLPIVFYGDVEPDHTVQFWRLRWVPRREREEDERTSRWWKEEVRKGTYGRHPPLDSP